MGKNPMHAAATAEHNTPRAIVEAARIVLGGIDLDPMSNAVAQRVIQARTFYTAADDCFTRDWKGRVLLNPAGGLVRRAWQRLMAGWISGAIPSFVWIGFSLEQLQMLQRDGKDLYTGPTPIEFPICIPSRRIAFEDQHGNPQRSPTHGNYICYGGLDRTAFRREFSVFGRVITGRAAPSPIRDDDDPYRMLTAESTDPARRPSPRY